MPVGSRTARRATRRSSASSPAATIRSSSGRRCNWRCKSGRLHDAILPTSPGSMTRGFFAPGRETRAVSEGRRFFMMRILTILIGIVLGAFAAASPALAQDIRLLNVSYDPTRELHSDINDAFIDQYKKDTGKTVAIEQSHGGSS